MQISDLHAEIVSLEFQIEYKEKLLDAALKNDIKLGESKKLLHEIRLLRAKLLELNNQNSKVS